MIRVAVVAEGQTEREFIKRIIAAPLHEQNLSVVPVLLGSSVVHGGQGGCVTVARVVRDMVHLYEQFEYVTSLLDFYGFQNKGDRSADQLAFDIKTEVQQRLGEAFRSHRIFPYIQQYEFESLLFSDVDKFSTIRNGNEKALAGLRRIRRECGAPEEINDSPQTAPSKRIIKLVRGYHKVVHGPQIAKAIGLDTILSECPRFRGWYEHLSNLKR